ncbi:MAG: glutathione S-transferase [Myxococcota bacterium]|jgi:glutathione S-transferase
MSVVLRHHPHSRAAIVVWMFEEVGVPYTIHHVDLKTGAQKAPDHVALNPMGKVPVLHGRGVGLDLQRRFCGLRHLC